MLIFRHLGRHRSFIYYLALAFYMNNLRRQDGKVVFFKVCPTSKSTARDLEPPRFSGHDCSTRRTIPSVDFLTCSEGFVFPDSLSVKSTVVVSGLNGQMLRLRSPNHLSVMTTSRLILQIEPEGERASVIHTGLVLLHICSIHGFE